MKVPSYPKVPHIGDPLIADLIGSDVVIQEKVDGSQFSFGVAEGVLGARSKGQPQDIERPDKLFAPTITHVRNIADDLTPGWIYRGEALCKSRHNTLQYGRAPIGNFVLFDIEDSSGYMSEGMLRYEATRLGFEYIEPFYEGTLRSYDEHYGLLERTSALGGVTVEGIVYKARTKRNTRGELLMAKLVGEAFREKHRAPFRAPRIGDDVVSRVASQYRTEARFLKAVAHLREAGVLTNTSRDIGPLLKELNVDFEAEWLQDAKDELWKEFRKPFMKTTSAGFAAWYQALIRGDASQFDLISAGLADADDLTAGINQVAA